MAISSWAADSRTAWHDLAMESATLPFSLGTGSGIRRYVLGISPGSQAYSQLTGSLLQALGTALDQAQLLQQQLDRTHLLSSDSVRDRVGE
jgi:hypothetical protein